MYRGDEEEEFGIDIDIEETSKGLESSYEMDIDIEEIELDSDMMFEELDINLDEEIYSEVSDEEEVLQLIQSQSEDIEASAISSLDFKKDSKSITEARLRKDRLIKSIKRVEESNSISRRQLIEKLSAKARTNNNNQVFTQINSVITSEKPEFLTEKQGILVKNRIHTLNTNQDINSFYNSEELNISQDTKEKPSNRVLFIRFVKSLKSNIDDIQNVDGQIRDRDAHKSGSAMDSLCSEQDPFIRAFENRGDNPVVLLEGATLGEGYVKFKCPVCKQEMVQECRLIAFLLGTVKGEIVTPLQCDCGSFSVLPEKGLKTLKSRLNKTGGVGAGNCGSDKITLYYPTNLEIANAFDDGFFDIDPKEDEIVKEIPVDWDMLCKDFYDSVKTFYLESSVDSSEKIGIKGIAKIISSSFDEYQYLKERATATLLYELDRSTLSGLSKSNQDSVKILTLYKNNCEGIENRLSEIGSIDFKDWCELEKKDDIIEFRNSFSKSCDDAIEECSKYKTILEEIENNSMLYSNLKITNASLEQDLVNNYLDREDLAELVDKITDCMIITNVVEEFMGNHTLRSISASDNKARKDSSYSSLLKRVLDINVGDDRSERLNKFITYFSNKIGRPIDVDISNFMCVYSTDTEFYSLLGKFAESLIMTDYYDAGQARKKLIENYGSILDKMDSLYTFKSIVKLIKELPDVNLNIDKFEFYFKDSIENLEELNDFDKSQIMNIYQKRRFSPKVLEGETIEDKIKYYINLEEGNSSNIRQMPILYKYSQDNFIMLKGLKIMSEFEPEDLSKFLLFRDLMFSFKELSLKEFCNCLMIEDYLMTEILDSSFEYTVNKSEEFEIVKYLIYRNKTLDNFFKESDKPISSLRKESIMFEKEIKEEFIWSKELTELFTRFMDEGDV